MAAATDPRLAGLFEDVYAAVGHHPHAHHARSLLQQLLANLTAPGVGGSAATQGWAAVLQQGQLLQAPHAWAGAVGAPGAAPRPDPHDPSRGGPVAISVLSLFLATALVAVNGMFSLWLRLGLHSKLAVATVRCIVQLSLLGYILVPIFVANRWWLTLLYTLFMLGVAAIEAVSRPAQNYSGMLPQVLLSLGLAASLVISYGLAVVVQVHPWYDAQYLIPMLGMLLGNACSGIAVGLSTVLDELSAGRDRVEMLLSMGASRVEATQDVVQRAVRISMTPLLNQLNVVGIVSIPGMMTGQILGGSDPATAARYQIVIMFLISATTALSSVATIFMAVFSIMDDHHRLRSERLRPKAGAGSGAVAWLQGQATRGWAQLRARSARMATRLRLAFGAVTWRTRHRYMFRNASDLSRGGRGASPVPRPYARVGSGAASAVESAAEEEGSGSTEGRAPGAGLREVVVGSGSDSGGVGSPMGEGSQPSPRVPLMAGHRRSGDSR